MRSKNTARRFLAAVLTATGALDSVGSRHLRQTVSDTLIRETQREYPMTLTSKDMEAIQALLEQEAEAVRRGDWAAVTSMFTVDAIRFPPHQPPVRGRDAMHAWLETFPPIQEFSISADEIVGCGDVAFVRGTYKIAVSSEAGGKPQTDRGNYMGFLRKQADGSCGPPT